MSIGELVKTASLNDSDIIDGDEGLECEDEMGKWTRSITLFG
jgi:hypothetical protein